MKFEVDVIGTRKEVEMKLEELGLTVVELEENGPAGGNMRVVFEGTEENALYFKDWWDPDTSDKDFLAVNQIT